MKKLIIALVFIAFFYLLFLYVSNNNLRDKEKCSCLKNGFLIQQSFYINGYSSADLKNAKVIVYKRNTNCKEIIDSTNLELVDADENYDSKKDANFKIQENKSTNNQVKFLKPVITKADWIIVLKKNKQIKITNIVTEIDFHMNMFSKQYYCRVVSLKVDHHKNDTLITGLAE